MLHYVFCIALLALFIVIIKVYIKFAYKFFEIAREVLDRVFDRE